MFIFISLMTSAKVLLKDIAGRRKPRAVLVSPIATLARLQRSVQGEFSTTFESFL